MAKTLPASMKHNLHLADKLTLYGMPAMKYYTKKELVSFIIYQEDTMKAKRKENTELRRELLFGG